MNWIITGAIRIDPDSQSESLEATSPVVILPGGQIKQPQFDLEFSTGVLSVAFPIARDEDDNLNVQTGLCSIDNVLFTVENIQNSLRVVADSEIEGELRVFHESSEWPKFILNLGTF